MRYFSALLVPLLLTTATAQTATPCVDVKANKPTIVVLPATKDGESPMTVWDNNFDVQVAVAKVHEAFQTRGFSAKGFEQLLNSANESKILTMENQADHKQELIRLSNAEIYVEVATNWHAQGGIHTATIILGAYESSTANNLASKTEKSNPNISSDKDAHLMGAVEKIADAFLDQMQASFTRMVEDGRPIAVEVTFATGSALQPSSPVEAKDGLELADVLEAWISENAYKGQYGQMNKIGSLIQFPDVHIPLRDPVKCKAFSTNMFGVELQKFMSSVGVPIGKEAKGNKLLITIK